MSTTASMAIFMAKHDFYSGHVLFKHELQEKEEVCMCESLAVQFARTCV